MLQSAIRGAAVAVAHDIIRNGSRALEAQIGRLVNVLDPGAVVIGVLAAGEDRLVPRPFAQTTSVGLVAGEPGPAHPASPAWG